MKVFCQLTIYVSLMLSQIAYALPFDIYASGSLPTTVIKGQTVSANYSVTNNTGSMRHNNYIKYLPPNVTQDTSGGAGTCGATFNLAPRGQPGDSCTLNLIISGEVDGNDPDPHHHLFACFQGGKSCAGTIDTLSVTELPILRTPRFAYVTQDSSNIQVCTINPDTGPNPGQFSGCQDAITGSTTGIIPTDVQGITFNAAGTIAYITPSGTTVSQCDVEQTGGTFTTCTQISIVSPATNYYGEYGIPLLNNDINNPLIYYVSYYSPEVFACPILAGVVSGTCDDAGVTGASYYAAQMAFNATNTTLYIANWYSGAGITTCTGSGTTFNVCHNVLGDGTLFFDEPSGVATTTSGQNLYIADYNAGEIYYCTTSQQSATEFTQCDSIYSVPDAWTITLNAAGTFAYIADYHSNVYTCGIDQSSGHFISCVPNTVTTFSDTVNVGLLY